MAVFCTLLPLRIFNLPSEIVGSFVLVFVIFHFTNAELDE